VRALLVEQFGSRKIALVSAGRWAAMQAFTWAAVYPYWWNAPHRLRQCQMLAGTTTFLLEA